MARLTGKPGAGKPPSFTKTVILQVKRGQLVASGWPRRRGKPKHPTTIEQNEWFRQANLLAKYADGITMWHAIEFARNSPLYPRDLIMSAMAGRFVERLTIDGQEYTSVAVRNDISADIDQIGGTLPGTLLVRGPALWQAFVPGAAGDVLTTQGAGALPTWATPGAGAAFALTQNTPRNIPATVAQATKGYPFVAASAFTIRGIGCLINAVVGENWQGSVLAFSAANVVTAVVATTPVVPITVTAKTRLFANLTVPAVTVPGTRYLLAWSMVNGPATFVNNMHLGIVPTEFPGLPIEYFVIGATVDLNSSILAAVPAVGNTITHGTTSSLYLPIVLSI